jgi:hypothetical protein
VSHRVRVTGGQPRTPTVVCATAKTTDPFRDAAVTLWGDAGAYACDAYDRIRVALYPDLPARLPIVIGLTAYGHCLGLTQGSWEHGPRISIFSPLFARGHRQVDDLLTHEMLHASLILAGENPKHQGDPWYGAVRRLSPAVLGHPLDARRGADRKSVRVPNQDWREDSSEPKTLVRKITVPDVVQHRDVAGWPQAFRPDAYDWGTPIACPTY